MKLEVSLQQLTEEPITCNKTVCVRIPIEDFNELKDINSNVSQVVRGLISQFLTQINLEKKSWIKSK